MKFIFAIVLASAIASGVAYADGPTREKYFLTGKDLAMQMREWEKGNRNDPKTDVVQASLFMGFVVGVHDASGGVCIPDGVKIGQLCEITASYINGHGEQSTESAFSIVVKALGQAFPCANERSAAIAPSSPPVRAVPLPRARSGVTRGSSDCESGHWIESVSDDGDIIKLEDGSIWGVDDTDTSTSSLWLAITDVLVCEGKGKMINVDDNESVAVRRLK